MRGARLSELPVSGSLRGLGHHLGRQVLYLVLHPGHYVVLAGHERLEALPSNVRGIALLMIRDFRVLHSGTKEKVRVVGPGCNAVTLTPVSLSSLRSVCANESSNALDAP